MKGFTEGKENAKEGFERDPPKEVGNATIIWEQPFQHPNFTCQSYPLEEPAQLCIGLKDKRLVASPVRQNLVKLLVLFNGFDLTDVRIELTSVTWCFHIV